eukprot:3963763-Amphidinium_carterae.1
MHHQNHTLAEILVQVESLQSSFPVTTLSTASKLHAAGAAEVSPTDSSKFRLCAWGADGPDLFLYSYLSYRCRLSILCLTRRPEKKTNQTLSSCSCLA